MMSTISRRVSNASNNSGGQDCVPIPSVIIPRTVTDYGGYPTHRPNHVGVGMQHHQQQGNHLMQMHSGMSGGMGGGMGGGMPRHLHHHHQHTHAQQQQQMNMESMMVNEYNSGMGRYEPNAIDMVGGSQSMPGGGGGRPLLMDNMSSMGQQGGSSMDQLMDFPSASQMYSMPPLRRPQARNSSIPPRMNSSSSNNNNMNQHHHHHSQLMMSQHVQQQSSSYNGVSDDNDTFAHKVPVHDSERYRTMVRSNVTNSSDDAALKASLISAGNSGKRKSRRPSTTSFPTKLYKILAEPKYQEYIAWLPHGRAWRVLKPKALEDDIIPKYFRSDRLASFMRQVNGWGFKRITEGPDLNAYYHEMFLRGLPHVCNKMRRPVRGETGLSRDLGQHPDFYKISMFAPLPPVVMKHNNHSDNDLQECESTVEEYSPAPTKVDFERSPGVVSRDESDNEKNRRASSIDAVVDHVDNDDHDHDDNKPLDVNHDNSEKVDICTSDNDDEEAADDSGALITSASLDSPPGSPTMDRSVSRNPSTAFFDNYGTLERTSSGHSLSSWNDQQEQDIMWSSGQSLGSPNASGGHDKWHTVETFPVISTNMNGFGHVTPPGGPMRIGNSASHLLPRRDQLRLPFDNVGEMSLYDEGGNDDRGLSAADLCYLTQQNRILLTHSTATNGQQRQDASK